MHSDIFPISYKCFLCEKLEKDGPVGFKKYSKDISTLGYTVIVQYSMCVLLVLICLPLRCVELQFILWTQGLELYRANHTLITSSHTRQQGIAMASKRFLEEDGLKLKLVLQFQQPIPLRGSLFTDKFRNTIVKEGSNVFTFENSQCFLEDESFTKVIFLDMALSKSI